MEELALEPRENLDHSQFLPYILFTHSFISIGYGQFLTYVRAIQEADDSLCKGFIEDACMSKKREKAKKGCDHCKTMI